MTRRGFTSIALAATAAFGLPIPAFALNVDDARGLIDSAVADVNRIIASGKSESAMFGDFERMFARYADVPVIARSALGPAARQASGAQLSAFTKAYQGYLSRKYGRRFREYMGGRIVVKEARRI
jgi:phospholipid transport system substrate-binding protein